jgi:UTP--glucose-1-phosphate uridylyltransferase
VFDALSDTKAGAGKEIQLTDAIKRTIESDRVVAIEFEGDYYDTGTIPGYLKANLALGLKREGLREELIELIRELVEQDAASRPGAPSL